MKYKILDVKADIHESVEDYFKKNFPDTQHIYSRTPEYWHEWKSEMETDILDIVDKHFEKIGR